MFWAELIGNIWKSVTGVWREHQQSQNAVEAPTGDKIVDWILNGFKKDTGMDVSHDELPLSRVKREAEKAHLELLSNDEVTINLPFLGADSSGPKHFKKTLSRVKYEKL